MVKYLHNTPYNPDYPWRPTYSWDCCPACFERFDFKPCDNCGNGHDQKDNDFNERVVLYVNNSPLLLSSVKRDADGKIISGFVVNGLWYLRIENKKLFAGCSEREPAGAVNVIDIHKIEEIKIPDKFRGNYDNIIAWAEEQRATLAKVDTQIDRLKIYDTKRYMKD